jgi:hypothetical protein
LFAAQIGSAVCNDPPSVTIRVSNDMIDLERYREDIGTRAARHDA